VRQQSEAVTGVRRTGRALRPSPTKVLDCSELEYLMGVAEREPGLRATGHEVDPLAFRDHRQAVARTLMSATRRHRSPS
jgi:hypothetical protein